MKFYGIGEKDADVWNLIWDLSEKGIPSAFVRTEYGPTVVALNYEDLTEDKDKFMDSIRGDFNAWWATEKYPDFAEAWFPQNEGMNYWWSFD